MTQRKPKGKHKTVAERELAELRREFQELVTKLKARGCEDSMILVEFWHALDSVNGETSLD
jgi:hypothetical protein